jgi:hypothetical protein
MARKRFNSRKDHIGRVRWKLFEMLTEHFSIRTPEDLWMQEGAYRSRYWDLARWGADWRDEKGVYWRVFSWSTMSDCVRYGFEFEPDGVNAFEISSRKPPAVRK